jgi:O-antigen ligase
MNNTYWNAAAVAQPKFNFLQVLVNCLAFLYATVAFVLVSVEGLSRTCLIVSMTLTLAVIIQNMQCKARFPTIFFLPWLFLFFNVLSIGWASDTGIALGSVASTFSAILGGSAIWQARNQGLSWKIVVWGVIAGSIVLIASARQQLAMEGPAVRASGLSGNANLFALLLSYAAFIIWCNPEKMSKWMNVLVYPLSVFFVYYSFTYSGSRKTLIVIAVGAIAFIVWSLFRIHKPSTWALLALVAFLFCGALVYIQMHDIDVMERVSSITTVDRMIRSLTGRDRGETRGELIFEALDLWEKSPFIGHGAGQSMVLSYQETYAHNNYAEILANFGMVGFLLYYSLHGVLFAKSFYNGIFNRSPPHRRVLVLLLLILLLDMAFVSYIEKGAWILLGMTASLVTAEKTNIVRSPLSVTRF